MGEVLKIKFAEEEKPNMGELAVAGNDITRKYGVSGENPDKLIATKGLDYIEKIEKDTHVSSQLATRRQKLIKKGWRLVPAEKNGKSTALSREIRDFVADQLRDMDGSFLKDVEAMLDATSKGFSITEKNFRYITKGRWKGKIGLKSLRFKPAKNFAFRYDKFGHYTLRQINPHINGSDLPLNKFIHLIAGPNDENPYGEGVTAKCAWWVWLKENEAKFWAIFSERFGMPQIKVEMPANPGPDDEQKAEDVIRGLQTSAGVKVPKGFIVDFMEAVRRGEVNYDLFIERANKEISKVILGATLVSEEGKRGQGSYALGHEHSGLTEDYIVFDAAITAQAINEQLIRQLVDYNYDTDLYPEFEWIGVGVDSFISFAQGLGILADKGLRVPVSWVRRMTGIPEAQKGEEVLQSAQFITPTDSNPEADDAIATMQSLNLNGIQIASAAKIIASVSAGEIPRDAGINQLTVFLGLTDEQANKVMGDAGTGKEIKADKITNDPKAPPAAPQNNIKKIKGTDNRAFADFMAAIPFSGADVPPEIQAELDEMDALQERYQKIRAERYAKLIKQFKQTVKKKRPKGAF